MTVHHRSDGPPKTFEIEDVEVKKETDKAIIIEFDGEERWIPKSQIVEESEVQGEGDEGTLVVTGWFAEREGLL